jgi:hypothetical protein
MLGTSFSILHVYHYHFDCNKATVTRFELQSLFYPNYSQRAKNTSLPIIPHNYWDSFLSSPKIILIATKELRFVLSYFPPY